MKVISKISELLERDKVQRICYLIALFIWLLPWSIGDFSFYNTHSSFGIKYIWLVSIPAILLTIQIILNKTIIWATIFGLFFMYSVFSIYSILTDIIERSGNHVKAISWSFFEICLLIVYFFCLFLINLIIYKLKPKKISCISQKSITFAL